LSSLKAVAKNFGLHVAWKRTYISLCICVHTKEYRIQRKASSSVVTLSRIGYSVIGLVFHDESFLLTGANVLESLDRLLLDRVQRSFPLTPEPYRALADGLGIDPMDVHQRIGRLKTQRIVRQISGIFNTGALGYRSSLVAMAVPEEDLERAAAVVNAYPGVSHNYLRGGRYNMWYTIAVPPGESVERKVNELAENAGGWPALVLPAERKFKLEVVLDVLEDAEVDSGESRGAAPQLEATVAFEPTPGNIRIVRCIQEDLPLVERPFKVWADGLNMGEGDLLAFMSDWIQRGIMRRFAAVLNHRQAGFSANGMVVWRCADDAIAAKGRILASFSEVSHCYHRPSYPEWPYNLYAMVHGRTIDECKGTAARLGEAIGLADYQILFSTREFKKIRLKLFWDEPGTS
jgi:siroheme decarboxylase